MRLELTGRHVAITPTLRRLVDTKLAKLERMTETVSLADVPALAPRILKGEVRGRVVIDLSR